MVYLISPLHGKQLYHFPGVTDYRIISEGFDIAKELNYFITGIISRENKNTWIIIAMLKSIKIDQRRKVEIIII